MEIPSKTFCSMAWDHQFIDPTGRVKPCCRFFSDTFRTDTVAQKKHTHVIIDCTKTHKQDI